MSEKVFKVLANTAEQQLTDSEKATARNNIGAVGTIKLGSTSLAPEPDSGVTIPAVDIIAGQNVTLTPVTEGVEISSADTTYSAGSGISIDGSNAISVDTSTVQEKLTAGTNIQISAQNVISATDTTYTAGSGLSLNNGAFSVDTFTVQAKLTAGANIQISAQNEISATDTTYGVFNTTTDGLVPKANGTGDTSKFLKGDGTWATPAAPAVNDGVLTIQKNGTQIGSFSANQSAGSTVNVEVPVLSTFESTDDEDIITYLNGLCVYKNAGQLLDGINGNVLALLPRPTGSADYGKYLYRNGNTIGYRDLPETAADLKILTETSITVNSGADAYELSIEDGRCYKLTMNANREVFLTTNSDKTVHTRIAIRNYGTSVCGGVTLTWYDEGLAEHSIAIDLSQQDNTIVYNFDVYIRKVTSGIMVYNIARVYDFPCSYRAGGYSGLDSTDNNMIGLDH